MANTKISFSTILSLLILVAACSAYIHEITIYQEENQQGEAVKFQLLHPSFTQWRFFLATAKSYCAKGWFTFFKFENYVVGSEGPWLFGGSEEEQCANSDFFRTAYSARHAGSSNTSTRSLSFYEEVGFGGREEYITGIAGSALPFPVRSYAISGNAKYTVFEGTNFNGTATCLEAAEGQTVSFKPSLPTPLVVGSLIRDCDVSKVDRYLH